MDCNPVSYTHLDVYKRQLLYSAVQINKIILPFTGNLVFSVIIQQYIYSVYVGLLRLYYNAFLVLLKPAVSS